MKKFFWQNEISRRGFLKGTLAGVLFSIFPPFNRFTKATANPVNPLFWIKDIPDQPFCSTGNGNYHAGVDYLLHRMGDQGLKLYRSAQETALSGPSGMIEPNDVVLIKVNAQWKYRGCTNSDLIRGLIQRILDHPDGFVGEVVIFENGQGRGSLNCDTSSSYGGDTSVHANANDESHSFLYLVNTIFNDPKVSAFLLDSIAASFIGATDHSANGYRIYENVSYPCFTTSGGHRVELMEGIWQGNGYTQNLKLINVPVLKHHDTGGSEITASLKHCYGIVSMSDGQSPFRHYGGLGETCGKMIVSVRTPILNIIDATWVSYSSITGYPASTTFRANQILASQDPVALDYWAAKYILYPIDNNARHHPGFAGIDQWLTSARDTINDRGGLYHPDTGILISTVTKNEDEMVAHLLAFSPGRVDFDWDGKSDILWRHRATGQNAAWLMDRTAWRNSILLPAVADTNWEIVGAGDFNNDGKTDILWRHKTSGQNVVWLMDGTTWSNSVWLPSVTDTNWEIVGVEDFNNDGWVDILWRHKTSGQNAVWLMNGTTWSSTVRLPAVADTDWEIVGAGDFNGDGNPDILWRYKTDGRNSVWLMNGTTWSSTVSLPGVADANWEIVGAGDFNNDGGVDILWRHKTSGQNAVWLMNGTTWSSTVRLPAVTDNNWEIVGP
jgi:hypothetical protein